MRWLQWATADLENGLGGVEVHARSLARELSYLGVSTALSSSPSSGLSSMNPSWDVFHTHGSAVSFFGTRTPRGAIRVHTLHGTTLGRMAACGEWTWPGGYFAALRELFGVLRAKIVLSIHADLWLYRFAQKLGKVCVVCSNGWDSSHQEEALPENLEVWLAKGIRFWVFIGRGSDPVKATDRIENLLKADPTLTLVTAPGEGFISSPRVIPTGQLSSAQIRVLLKKAQGLLLTSLYEGLPLVVLEALALGTPVLATPVGGLKALQTDFQGLSLLAYDETPAALAHWQERFRTLDQLPSDEKSRQQRADWNRTRLATWKWVAEVAYEAVKNFKRTHP